MINKICIITSAHSVFDVRIFHKEIKSLQGAGYEITLIAQGGNEQAEGVKIITVLPARNRFDRFFVVMPKMVAFAFKQKADAYHFHDPDLIIAGLLLKLFTRSKVVYDVHEDVPRQILSKFWIPGIFRKSVAAIFSALEKTISKTFDAIIAATPAIAKKFGSVKTVCVANYPKLEYFDNIVSPKKESRFPKFSVIYVGGLDKIRGIEEMIKAYDFINDKSNINLVLAGPFSDDIFEKKLKESDGWKKIDYLGFLPVKDAYKKMVEADAGLVCFLPEPNHVEALPNKIFEYMAAGIPVIASDFPLWKEIIEGRECGICVDPEDPKAIAGAIQFLAKHPDRAKKMGENGRQSVRKVYNWDKESRKLLKLYRDFDGISR